MVKVSFSFVLVLLCVTQMIQGETRKITRIYTSPDKALTANVISWSKNGESTIEFWDQAGKLLRKKDYTSDDGEHGYYVAKAQWTPDSQFFVYSLESSGGHSVMVVPTVFYSAQSKRIFNLGELVGNNIIFPDFFVVAPDKVKITVQQPERTIPVSLSSLLRKTNSAARKP